MFHFVFDKRGAELIGEAMDLDETLDGELIFFNDDYSIGPLSGLFEEEGLNSRREWLISIDARDMPACEDASRADRIAFQNVSDRMREEVFDQIWIWLAPNARDLSGYYWLMNQLKEFQDRVYVLSLNNLPFINEKGAVFYPAFLSEIPVREFVKARKLARPISPAEFETDPDEWNRLVSENKMLRIFEGGKKIVQQEEDFLDLQLMASLQSAFQKHSRITQLFVSRSGHKVNESFLLWRLKQLASAGLIEQHNESFRQLVKETDEVK
jgi:hypothetical protein